MIYSKIKTYLIISNRSEILVGDIFSNGGYSKRTVLIIWLTNDVSTIWFNTFAKVIVRLHISTLWLSMDASSSVPRVFTLNIFNAMDKVWASVSLSLAQVFGDSKKIRGNSLVIFHSLLHDSSFGVLFIDSFAVESHGCSIQNSLLSISKPVSGRVKLPIVLSLLLLAWSKVAMGVSIHGLDGLIIVSCTC